MNSDYTNELKLIVKKIVNEVLGDSSRDENNSVPKELWKLVPVINNQLIKQLNGKLYDLTHNKYFTEIPSDKLHSILAEYGLAKEWGEEGVAVARGIMRADELSNAFGGLFTGRDGSATALIGQSPTHRWIGVHMQWHKMNGKHYEINAYAL